MVQNTAGLFRSVVLAAAALVLAVAAPIVFPRNAATFPASETPVLDLATAPPTLRLEPYLSFLTDCSGGMTFEQALSASDHFERASEDTPSFGYSQCAYWFRIIVRDSARSGHARILTLENPRVDEVDVHFPDTGRVVRTGATIPIPLRSVRHRSPAVSLGPSDESPSTILLRLRTSDVATFPLRLSEQPVFEAQDHREQIIFGIYFGLFLFACVFNLIVAGSQRDVTYLLWAVLTVCHALFTASVLGLGFEYLWPRALTWNMTAIPLFCGLTLSSAALFSFHFLELSHGPRALAYLVHAVNGAGWTTSLAALFANVTLAGELGSVSASFAVISFGFAGVVAAIRGHTHAKVYVVGGALMFCGVCLNGLRNFAVVPDTFLTANGNQIGSSLYVICLTFALMTRLNIAQREKDLAQQQAFRNQQIAAETQRNAVEMKLQALQAKINPHFLFNALNTIAGLIAEAPERAEGVVIKLSKLFRYTLTATEKDRVLLSEELAIVRSYLEIEQARFGDRLAFEIRQDPNIDGVTLPGLTLQPLVENCVKHGLRSKLQGGKVLVIANVDGDSCHLVVEDDGVGMAAGAGRGGHGLANVRERLQLAFGADFQMHIVSESGVRIDIRIPVR